ncbi:nucleotide exchange factor GrpE [Amycolatopsis sp., V23-08]|uniref:Nucleotide exchange factor GrpE n=1 Tax=Amycolatopsis heterodermiae TaxID=3110235 RepID=A0ABU5R5M3_9PSEU|nr:nucleotide exchange factor GrpE [Amycolatopsis sp., V23-08]MEA5361530.1 nucleotide exchange factor GrpE [Amycolatopsis sp., V23-08]
MTPHRLTLAAAAVAAALLAFIVVMLLEPAKPDTRRTAAEALAAAVKTGDAGAVAAVLPSGARAVVVLPPQESGLATGASTADGAVALYRGDVDVRPLLDRLSAAADSTASVATPDGAWAAVATEADSPLPAAFAGAGLAAVALVAGARVFGRAPTARPAAADPGHRELLILRLAELMPQLPEGLAWQAANALAAAGVRPVSPDGAPFDPRAHQAVGTEPAPDTGRVDTVARTVRPGYSDGARVVVYPKVVVYADAAPAGRPADD